MHNLDISKLAYNYLDGDKNPRSKESKLMMAQYVANMKVKDFVPDDKKA